MQMPIMDGYEATAKIRQLENGDTVKIIATSASVFREQDSNMIAAGCDVVLHKPVQFAEVFSILNQVLGVEFIYQEQTTSALPKQELTLEKLSTLPMTLTQQLHQAALSLDTEETEHVIKQIQQLNPEVADVLSRLAQSYQFEQIIQLTKDNG